MLFTGSADNMARCWNIDIAECSQVYQGHKNSITALALKGDYCELIYTTSGSGYNEHHNESIPSDHSVRVY